MNLVIIPVYELSGKKPNFPWFQEMAELCSTSFKKNLEGLDEVVFLGNDGKAFASYTLMFRDIFQKTWSFWSEGHNIFFSDADALCVRPIKVFGKFSDFRLFAEGEENSHEGTFPTYMLSGSRYFPSSMNKNLWEIGDSIWLEEEETYWDFEQYVYNCMFFSQPRVRENWKAYIWNGYNLFYEWEGVRDATPSILSYSTASIWRGDSKSTMEERFQIMKDRFEET